MDMQRWFLMGGSTCPQVCVVYWSVMKWWCRAVVEALLVATAPHQARVLLVDYGERLVVSSDQ